MNFIVENGAIDMSDESDASTKQTVRNRTEVENVSGKRKQAKPKKYTVDSLTPLWNESVSEKRKRGRPRKYAVDSQTPLCNESAFEKRKRGRPRKLLDAKTSLLSSSVHEKRKRGRPRKCVVAPKALFLNGVLDVRKSGLIKEIYSLKEAAPVTKPRERHPKITQESIAQKSDFQRFVKRRGRPKGSTKSKYHLHATDVGFRSTESLRESDHPSVVISKFCKQMYHLGWATGTGGGMSVKKDDIIYMAPSAVQKEMIQPDDIFQCDSAGMTVCKPAGELKLTECAPLFMLAYSMRDAGAVIHSHGIYAVLASLLYKGDEFRITHLEMIKGIKKGSTKENLKYNDTLVVPIIENTLYECDLTTRMKIAIEKYPDSNAVLVRRHGVYIWGHSWQKAKSQAECYHYLFEAAVKMKQMGIAPDEGLENDESRTDL